MRAAFILTLMILLGPLPSAALEPDEVIRWTDTVMPLKRWADAHKGQVEGELNWTVPAGRADQPISRKQLERMMSPFSQAAEAIERADVSDEPRIIVSAKGFDGLDEWGEIGDRILRAYTAFRAAPHMPNRQELKASRQQIESMERLNETEKAALLARLDAALLIWDVFEDVPQEDINAVAASSDLVARVLGN